MVDKKVKAKTPIFADAENAWYTSDDMLHVRNALLFKHKMFFETKKLAVQEEKAAKEEPSLECEHQDYAAIFAGNNYLLAGTFAEQSPLMPGYDEDPEKRRHYRVALLPEYDSRHPATYASILNPATHEEWLNDDTKPYNILMFNLIQAPKFVAELAKLKDKHEAFNAKIAAFFKAKDSRLQAHLGKLRPENYTTLRNRLAEVNFAVESIEPSLREKHLEEIRHARACLGKQIGPLFANADNTYVKVLMHVNEPSSYEDNLNGVHWTHMEFLLAQEGDKIEILAYYHDTKKGPDDEQRKVPPVVYQALADGLKKQLNQTAPGRNWEITVQTETSPFEATQRSDDNVSCGLQIGERLGRRAQGLSPKTYMAEEQKNAPQLRAEEREALKVYWQANPEALPSMNEIIYMNDQYNNEKKTACHGQLKAATAFVGLVAELNKNSKVPERQRAYEKAVSARKEYLEAAAYKKVVRAYNKYLESEKAFVKLMVESSKESNDPERQSAYQKAAVRARREYSKPAPELPPVSFVERHFDSLFVMLFLAVVIIILVTLFPKAPLVAYAAAGLIGCFALYKIGIFIGELGKCAAGAAKAVQPSSPDEETKLLLPKIKSQPIKSGKQSTAQLQAIDSSETVTNTSESFSHTR